MHKLAIALMALGLLAACGSDEPTEHSIAAPEPSAVAGNEPDPARMPAPSADGVDRIDYSGSYTFIDLDGSQSTLTLDKEAGTYEYVSPSGITSGMYERLDGGRIAIRNFNGGVGYFSIASGALYRLAGQASAYDEIDPGRMYRRSDYKPEAGPGAARPSVAITEKTAGKRD